MHLAQFRPCKFQGQWTSIIHAYTSQKMHRIVSIHPAGPYKLIHFTQSVCMCFFFFFFFFDTSAPVACLFPSERYVTEFSLGTLVLLTYVWINLVGLCHSQVWTCILVSQFSASTIWVSLTSWCWLRAFKGDKW